MTRLEAALWGGLSGYAIAALERLAEARGSDDDTRLDAIAVLAAWHLDKGDASRALGRLRAAPRRSDPTPARRLALTEAEALIVLGRADEAEAAIEQLRAAAGDIPDYWFARANLSLLATDVARSAAADKGWLAAANQPLIAAGVAPLALREPGRGFSLANIAAQARFSRPAAQDAKVSIILPAYNAAETLAFSIGSLLEQTWTNIEALVVDDCSSDASWELISSIAAQDNRVVPLRHDANRGTYPAMNTALERATGAFVTTHGADDWSHPEKLARQLRPMLDGEADCTVSWAVRVTRDMRVELRPRTASHLFPNVSSILFRREELDELGGWDEVRADADAEIYARYRARFGKQRLDVLPEVPLSLISARPDSLTRNDATGLATIGYGARRQYREAYSYWHRQEAARETPDLRSGPGRRPFPVPAPLLTRTPEPMAFDVVLVSDFAAGKALCRLNLELWRAARAEGLSIALLHRPRPNSAGKPVDRAIRAIMHEASVESLVAGASARCRLALVSAADVLEYPPDCLPAVTADALLIRLDRTLADTERMRRLADRALQTFGREPVFVPAGRSVRRRVHRQDGAIRLRDEDWDAAFPNRAGRRGTVFAALASRSARR